MCLAQANSERINAARQSGEVTVKKGEHIFALGRALLGDDLARVNQFRKDVVVLNPELGTNGERISAGMRLRLPEYIKTPAIARTVPSASPAARPSQSKFASTPSLPSGSRPASHVASRGPTQKPAGAVGAITAPKRVEPFAPALTSVAPTLASAAPRPPGTPVTASPQTPTEQRVMSFDVTVNGAKAGAWVFLERGSELYTTRDAFDEWRVQLPATAPSVQFRGEQYFALSAISDFKSKVDFANQSIALLFTPQSFSATRLTQELIKKPVVSDVLPSAFFNYDLNLSRAEQRGSPRSNALGLLTEIGASTNWGVLTSSGVGNNLTGDPTQGDPRKWVRLETTFTKDFPEDNRTLRLGDTRSQGGMLGRDVYFGGIQYGTNFSLSPGFVTNPLPTLNGASAAQSTVELYVNDVLRQSSSVPTGPFTLDRVPGLTGSGEARIVVRDILGRETVIVQPFFTSSRLLSAGLTDWRVEAGSVRRDLGTKSGNYGPGFVSGAWRHGASNDVTLEGSGTVTPLVSNLGLGTALALPLQLLGKAGLSLSKERSLGAGNQWLLGLEHQSNRNNFSLQAQAATINYRQLGQAVTVNPVKQQYAGNWNYSTTNWGSFGLGFAFIRQFDDSEVKAVSANYSVRVGEQANLSVTASQVLSESSSPSVGMTLVVPLSNNIISTAAVSRTNGQAAFHATASKNPGQGEDQNLGWRVLAGREQESDRVEGGLTYLGRYGQASGDISHSPAQTSTRLGAVGGVVLADGNLFATRRVDQSFAIAEIAGYVDVGVGLGNNMLTKTDKNGVALIPQLVPYQNNQIRLNPQDLPVSADVQSIELLAVPPYRSAVKVTFPVRSGRGALLKIVMEDGEPAPAGAIVEIVGDKEEFYVARRGEAFVTGLLPGSRVTLKWKERQCSFAITLPIENPDDIPRIGPFTCTGVTR